MLAEDRRQFGIIDAIGAGPQRTDRVLLGRVHVGEVLDELVLQRICGHTPSLVARSREANARRTCINRMPSLIRPKQSVTNSVTERDKGSDPAVSQAEG